MSIKKISFLSILSFLLIFTLMACGNNEGNKQENNNNNEGNDNNSNNDGNVEEVYKLKLNDLFPPTKYDYEPRNYATNIFSEKVKEATDGRVEIEVFNSAQLAQTDQLMDVLSSGSIDFGTSGAHLFGDIIPASHAINLPFWAKDEENAKELLNSEYGDIFKESFEDYGVKVMIAYPTSNQIIMSTNPVKTLDDFNGKLFRIESGLWDSWYQEIGLSPVNVDSSEIYNAMQLGTIDGLFYADYTLETANYHEVVDYVTNLNITPAIINMTSMSMESWDKLPDDLKEIVSDVALEVQDEAFEASLKMTELANKAIEENEIEVVELDDSEKEKIMQSSLVIWDEVANINETTAKMVELLKQNQNMD